MADEKQVIAEVLVDADPETVWRAISDGEEVSRWFSPEARVSGGVGGSLWLSWGEGMAWEAPIELWEPNRHLRTVDPPPSKAAVDYIIEARGSETLLRIVQSGFAAETWDDEIDTLTSGWRAFAENFKFYVERHRGKPRTMAMFRHPVVEMERTQAFPLMLDALGLTVVGEGEPFRGPFFEGVARVVAPPVNFSATLSNHGEAFLMVELEPGRGKCRPAVWVSLYGESGSEAEALKERLRDAVTRAFTSA